MRWLAFLLLAGCSGYAADQRSHLQAGWCFMCWYADGELIIDDNPGEMEGDDTHSRAKTIKKSQNKEVEE